MHPGLELVGEMKRLRRAPEPTSAMEPWLQKAVDAKLLIEKNTRVRSSDGSKAVAKAVGYTCAKDSCGMLSYFTLNVSNGRPLRLGRGSLVLEADRVRRLEHVPPHCSVHA